MFNETRHHWLIIQPEMKGGARKGANNMESIRMAW